MSLPDGYHWDNIKKKLHFFGKDGILLWKNPTLKNMLTPLIEQLGESFYFLLVAYEASEGAKQNYNYIITRKNSDFEQGFEIWAGVVASAGWGFMSLKSVDWRNNKAILVIEDPFELVIRETQNINDNLPLICGKASGIFSIAMNCSMRALVTAIETRNERKYATIEILPTEATLKSELEELNAREGHTRYEHLQILNKKLQETQSELEAANRRLTELAIKDDLTGAFNRRFFLAQAAQHHSYQVRYKMPVSVMMLDIDHFKKVNDTYGHHAGDLALIEFSNTCIENLRDTDMFSRLGGEEFAISMPGLDLSQAMLTAEKIRQLIEKLEIQYEDNITISFTVSIGVVEMQQKESLESALNRADKALYQAKHNGRNRVVSV
ncbi:diguanylate cyclase [Alkalimarinus alittae]|uniref:diguanylate cyclase n=1 Tax=Alkalimarinus alittae TaxID=2961619 RepID=A0ABY6N5U2_9ALTE|nr:diguanylate cyclase [Alkalimarinus alittae]UZE97405.1 diguanylate cyclase [Alkalimarinus alittae]